MSCPSKSSMRCPVVDGTDSEGPAQTGAKQLAANKVMTDKKRNASLQSETQPTRKVQRRQGRIPRLQWKLVEALGLSVGLGQLPLGPVSHVEYDATRLVRHSVWRHLDGTATDTGHLLKVMEERFDRLNVKTAFFGLVMTGNHPPRI